MTGTTLSVITPPGAPGVPIDMPPGSTVRAWRLFRVDSVEEMGKVVLRGSLTANRVLRLDLAMKRPLKNPTGIRVRDAFRAMTPEGITLVRTGVYNLGAGELIGPGQISEGEQHIVLDYIAGEGLERQERGGREQGGREQGGREQGGREQGGRERGGRERLAQAVLIPLVVRGIAALWRSGLFKAVLAAIGIVTVFSFVIKRITGYLLDIPGAAKDIINVIKGLPENLEEIFKTLPKVVRGAFWIGAVGLVAYFILTRQGGKSSG